MQIIDSTHALMNWQKHKRGAEHHEITKEKSLELKNKSDQIRDDYLKEQQKYYQHYDYYGYPYHYGYGGYRGHHYRHYGGYSGHYYRHHYYY